MKLLHVDSSVLGQNSASRTLGAAIVAQLRTENPRLEITYRDVAAQTLPHYTPVLAEGHPCIVRNQEILDEFLAADSVVIGAPMYNFTIPTQLKAWLDRILIAGKTFRYTESGPQGLVHGKHVIIASSRGGIYSEGPGQAIDFQEPYLRQVFGMIGIDDIEFVRAEGLNLGAEHRAAALANAHARISGGLSRAA